jgi:hypothetical protein
MAVGDLIHAILLLTGLCVGLGVGSRSGIGGAVVGAVVGFAAGHVVAVGHTIVDLVAHGIGRWWSRKGG